MLNGKLGEVVGAIVVGVLFMGFWLFMFRPLLGILNCNYFAC